MLSCEFSEQGGADETIWIDGASDAAGGFGHGGRAGPTGDGGGERSAGHGAGDEPRDDNGEDATGAFFENHGSGSRGDAGGEIQFQADAGDERVWAPGDAHRAVQQFSLREDIRDYGAEAVYLRLNGILPPTAQPAKKD